MKREVFTHYQTLGVPPSISPHDLRDAYLKLALKHHPDTGAHADGPHFARITEAYSVLKDGDRRREYDAVLALLVEPCAKCKGEGVLWKTKGFTARVSRPCPDCGGAGRA